MKKSLVLVIAVCVFGLLCGISQANEADAVVDCKNKVFLSGEDDGDINSRDEGGWVRWTIYAVEDTWVEFEFVKKDGAPSTESPFIDKQTKFTETLEIKAPKKSDKIKRGSIRRGAKGKYEYKITCHYPDGNNYVIDPIIEIPKPPHLEVPPGQEPPPQRQPSK